MNPRTHRWRSERRVPLQFWPGDPEEFDPRLYVTARYPGS
jgi:hypothetical protein